MMSTFFNAIQSHYSNHLPFVIYKKPNASKLKAILQQSNTIEAFNDYSEEGFVFSPFNQEQQGVLFPLSQSKVIEVPYVETNSKSKLDYKKPITSEDKLAHITLVTKTINAIKKTPLKKVVVSRKQVVTLNSVNVFKIFKQLLHLYPEAFVYCWYHPKIGLWLGATPETLSQFKGKQFLTMALAGTQPFKDNEEVVWKEKERNEQSIVTKYIVEALNEVAERIELSEVKTIKAGSLLHLQTTIKGLMQRSSDLKNIINLLHPTPAVCGFPKEMAAKFILENEAYSRGYYTGYLGELNFKEEHSRNTNKRNIEQNAYRSITRVSNFYVNLRCMELIGLKANIFVGGGITEASIPELEWEETQNKMQTMLRVLDINN